MTKGNWNFRRASLFPLHGDVSLLGVLVEKRAKIKEK